MNALHVGAWILGAGTVVALLLNGTHLFRLLRDGVWAPFLAHLRKISVKDRRDIDAELDGLRRQVDFLTRQVADLRVRDELNWAYTLSEQEWHRKYELREIEAGREPMPYIPYVEFRERWLKKHKDYEPFN